MIDYEALSQFVAFSEAGTLAQVAESFNISQPSVTRNMKRLEEEFGVVLFEREKNRIRLNEAGRLAVEEGERVLAQTAEMLRRVRAADKARHTITLGSCSVLPVPELYRRIGALYPRHTLSTEARLPAELLQGLKSGEYQLILLPYEPSDEELIGIKVGEEHLLLCLPEGHRLAGEKSARLEQMDGENMLMLEQVGFWADIVRKKLPNSRFLLQSERYSLGELITNSILPCFISDEVIRQSGSPSQRVNVPITDPEVNVSYYLVTQKKNKARFSPLFKERQPSRLSQKQ